MTTKNVYEQAISFLYKKNLFIDEPDRPTIRTFDHKERIN